ncbi:RNA-binding transcriptional accessory protein [Motiliproteus coralliicola]|uniref:RNA-binding transcriptional accessory protein n=1 Tax=Motiliproteus coralliicola TaxID=2283196 RepID=A0A369WM99_9GAMM|nr:Tex family protein [Motiliproteus coralliicola]RDE22601.1 RNA-binding transcriptional accessory protein [Motiliproteus coralliicola]
MLHQRIASELQVKPSQVEAAVKLLDEGATVPFIARYRKEVTGALDDSQLRQLQERLSYLRELDDRREVILRSIDEQGLLNGALRAQLMDADSKVRLEDLYLPYRPKRRTKAQMAREAGIDPLLDQLLKGDSQTPEQQAQGYLNAEAGYADTEAVLAGAAAILVERISEQADLVSRLRDQIWRDAALQVTVIKKKAEEGAKFRDYFDHREPLKRVPSHRALAILRGVQEKVLTAKLDLEEQLGHYDSLVSQQVRFAARGRCGDWVRQTLAKGLRSKLIPQLEKELIGRMREAAEEEAIRVFSRNLKQLLLSAPAGRRPTLGLDPGLRTGVKVAVVDSTGKLVAHSTIYPHVPRNDWDRSIESLAKLCEQHRVELISIGNGTGSRETDTLVSDLFKRYPEIKAQKVMVNEAGASVYSASELAANEFPDLDVTIRGAVSIARRLQDPLAELVKIEPKAIGVGQYQHDLNQTRLAHSLDGVVEDCVNQVGVDLNTASEALLARISGLSTTLARNIVAYRDENGAFANRTALKKVARLGPKAFEQAAGFLRIQDGKQPLDGSSVHPEAYDLVKKIAAENNRTLPSLIGDAAFLRNLNPQRYVDDRFGDFTVRDILKELEKPGRDPRPEFKTARFQDGVEKPSDLKPGMRLEGTVTNVANFGAFVDIGVHQDGLVHISQLADRFVKDPQDIVKPGDIVQVRVLEVDLKRQRISLSMKREESGTHQSKPKPNRPQTAPKPSARASKQAATSSVGTFGQLLQQAQKKKR